MTDKYMDTEQAELLIGLKLKIERVADARAATVLLINLASGPHLVKIQTSQAALESILSELMSELLEKGFTVEKTLSGAGITEFKRIMHPYFSGENDE